MQLFFLVFNHSHVLKNLQELTRLMFIAGQVGSSISWEREMEMIKNTAASGKMNPHLKTSWIGTVICVDQFQLRKKKKNILRLLRKDCLSLQTWHVISSSFFFGHEIMYNCIKLHLVVVATSLDIQTYNKYIFELHNACMSVCMYMWVCVFSIFTHVWVCLISINFDF